MRASVHPALTSRVADRAGSRWGLRAAAMGCVPQVLGYEVVEDADQAESPSGEGGGVVGGPGGEAGPSELSIRPSRPRSLVPPAGGEKEPVDPTVMISLADPGRAGKGRDRRRPTFRRYGLGEFRPAADSSPWSSTRPTWQSANRSGGLAIFIFHGVGVDRPIGLDGPPWRALGGSSSPRPRPVSHPVVMLGA